MILIFIWYNGERSLNLGLPVGIMAGLAKYNGERNNLCRLERLIHERRTIILRGVLEKKVPHLPSRLHQCSKILRKKCKTDQVKVLPAFMYDLLEVHHVHHENSKLIHDRVEYFVYPFPDCRILSENDDSFLPSPSKGGAGATPHFSFFFILTLLHLEL